VQIEGIATQELSDEAPRRGRGGRGRSNERSDRGGRSGGRGRREKPAPRVDPIDAAIPHPTAELHRKDKLAAATALPEIADQVAADHPIAPVVVGGVVGPVTSDGLPSQSYANRHERRSQHHAEQHGEHHGGPFGDHTPEFFAREQRRALQTTERRAAAR
jgi:hypothetical protein